MKLKYILPAIIAGVGLLFSSCEDGLDIPKHGNMGTQDDFYKTDSEALEAVSTLYSSWAGNYYNLFMLKNLLSAATNLALNASTSIHSLPTALLLETPTQDCMP